MEVRSVEYFDILYIETLGVEIGSGQYKDI